MAIGLQYDPENPTVISNHELDSNGVNLKNYHGDLPEEAKKFNDELVQALQRGIPIPQDTLFSDEYFNDTIDLIQDRNDDFIVRTIFNLMFPNVQEMVIRGKKDYECFDQSFNEVWNCCKAFKKYRPQPASSVGLSEEAFSPEQLKKLRPYLGDLFVKSDLKVTYNMLFPFLSLEVTCINVSLGVADRQNALCAAVAGRALAELFRLTGKQEEFLGKIFFISISFDDRGARIYGYLAINDGYEIVIHRRKLAAFDYSSATDGSRWKCLQYGINAIDFLGYSLRKSICSAIDGWTPDP